LPQTDQQVVWHRWWRGPFGRRLCAT
jgi:hypothetical protein